MTRIMTLAEVESKSLLNRAAHAPRRVELGSAGGQASGRPKNGSPSTAHQNKPKRIKRAPTPLEHDEQVMVINWWRDACTGFGVDERLLFAIPNGSNKSMVAAIRFKAEGLRSGCPDLVLAVPRLIDSRTVNGWHHGLFIEMKRIGRWRPGPEQMEYHDILRKQGYRVDVCYGHADAIAEIKNYLGE